MSLTPRNLRRRAPLVLALLLGVAALGLTLPGCLSMSKEDVERALLAQPAHAPLAERGLARVRFPFEVDGETVAAEATYLHVPARAGAPLGGRPVVLVHGTPGSLFAWRDLVFGPAPAETAAGEARAETFAGLAGELDLWLVDLVGHGTTRTETPPYSFQRCADWLGAVLAALELEDVCLVGHSYGGEVAWRAALDAPERVSSLVLLDSAGLPRPADGWLPEEEKMREWPFWVVRRGYWLNSRERIRGALAPHFGEPVADHRVEALYLCCENADDWRAMVELARDENGTRAAELARLAQPTLLVWGADDLAYPPETFARRFERELPAARLVVLERTGHYPHEERPAEVARHLRAFLAELPSPAKGAESNGRAPAPR